MERFYLLSFLSRRMLRKSSHEESKRALKLIRFAIPSIALSLCVMLLTVSVVSGFKGTIRDLVSLVSGDVILSEYQKTFSDLDAKITLTDTSIEAIQSIPYVESVRPIVQSAGIIKTDSSFYGVGIIGLDNRCDLRKYDPVIVDGAMPDWSITGGNNDLPIVISSELSETLQAKLGDKIRLYLTNPKITVRAFKVAAIIEMGRSEQPMVYVPMGTLRKSLHWTSSTYSRLEIFIKPSYQVAWAADRLTHYFSQNEDLGGQHLGVTIAQELNADIYTWIDMIDSNVVILLFLMAAVCVFTLINCLLILILDRTQSIGIFKALGCGDRFLESLFIAISFRIVLRGVFWGNIVALTLAVYQYYTHSFALDPANYYVSYVPVTFSWWQWLLINISTIVLSLLVLLIPVRIISRIHPSQAMRFE